MSAATTAAEVEEHLRSLVDAIDQHSQCLADAKSDLQRSEVAWRSQAEQSVTLALREADKVLVRHRKGIEANAEEARTVALSVARRAATEHAPGYLSANWNSPMWTELPIVAAGKWLRVGTATFGTDYVPVVVPLSVGLWRVISPDADTLKVLAHNTIARVVTAFGPTRVMVTAFDPELSLDLAAFAELRGLSRTSVPAAINSEEDFERELEELQTAIALVHDRLTAAGQRSYWSAQESRHEIVETIPFRLLIIGSTTEHLTARAGARLAQIGRLAAEQGVLIMELVKTPPPASSALSITISLSDPAAATVSSIPGIVWTLDPWAGDRFIRGLSARLIDRPRQELSPTIGFREIIESIDDPWMSAAHEGLESVIGRMDGGELILRLRSENPPMPNALIGGAVGEGKSNLLLVLIHSLAARYSPAELEMVLVDLRDGVEFARLGPRSGHGPWLPHVRSLGLEFDHDYSIAVLRWVRSQMADRSRLLKANSATTLKQYHEKTGNTIPRLLVIIDEFQRLFDGNDDQSVEAASQLEGIARMGRGFGVHLVLASQALSGLRGLASKADAIFGQFHNRVTLRNTPVESQAFLTTHNLAAAELEHRGQVVVNDSLGAVDANKIGIVAYADPSYLEQLQLQLFQQGHGSPPSVFRASAYADWPTMTPERSAGTGIDIVVGMPISVEPTPRNLRLSRSPNQGVAVVGTDRSVAIPILVRASMTAAMSLGGHARIIILDADGGSAEPSAWLGTLMEHLIRCCKTVERVPRDRIAARLIELGKDRSTADVVVAVALDSVDLGTPTEPDYLIPNDVLRELVKNGPLTGTWTIGWWQSMPVLEEHLGYRAPAIRAWAFCGATHDDLTSICGHAVRPPSASPRFVWLDRTAGSTAERLVPFAVDDLIGPLDFG